MDWGLVLKVVGAVAASVAVLAAAGYSIEKAIDRYESDED